MKQLVIVTNSLLLWKTMSHSILMYNFNWLLCLKCSKPVSIISLLDAIKLHFSIGSIAELILGYVVQYIFSLIYCLKFKLRTLTSI